MYSLKSRVRYSEINSRGELALSSLLDYLQDCCSFQSEELGVGVGYLVEKQVTWVLSSWRVRVQRYPGMGETICVNTWPYDFKGFYGYRNFSITDEQGEILAEANSIWVFMDLVRMRPAQILEEIRGIYEPYFKPGIPNFSADRKLTVTQGGIPADTVRVARFHIDTNDHMNNGKYVLIAEEYLPEGFVVQEMRAEYKRSAMLGDMIYPMVTVGEGSVTVVLEGKAKEPYAIVRFVGQVEETQ